MVVPLAAWRRQPVPIATITKGKSEAYVVVLDDGEVVIRPWMRAATARNGFGDVEAPGAAQTVSGPARVTMSPRAPQVGFLRLLAAKMSKRDVQLRLHSDRQVFNVSFLMPEPAKKK